MEDPGFIKKKKTSTKKPIFSNSGSVRNISNNLNFSREQSGNKKEPRFPKLFFSAKPEINQSEKEEEIREEKIEQNKEDNTEFEQTKNPFENNSKHDQNNNSIFSFF